MISAQNYAVATFTLDFEKNHMEFFKMKFGEPQVMQMLTILKDGNVEHQKKLDLMNQISAVVKETSPAQENLTKMLKTENTPTQNLPSQNLIGQQGQDKKMQQYDMNIMMQMNLMK